jgi:hypothetical protein
MDNLDLQHELQLLTALAEQTDRDLSGSAYGYGHVAILVTCGGIQAFGSVGTGRKIEVKADSFPVLLKRAEDAILALGKRDALLAQTLGIEAVA